MILEIIYFIDFWLRILRLKSKKYNMVDSINKVKNIKIVYILDSYNCMIFINE